MLFASFKVPLNDFATEILKVVDAEEELADILCVAFRAKEVKTETCVPYSISILLVHASYLMLVTEGTMTKTNTQ